MWRRAFCGCVLGALSALPGCGAEEVAARKAVDPASLSEGANPQLIRELRERRDRDVHPADGGGRAWLVSIEEGTPLRASPDVMAASRARIALRYEVGPQGIARGGRVALEVSPYWEWDWPQAKDADAAGYTTVKLRDGAASDIELISDERRLLVTAGRALAPGEQIDFVYGAGEKLTRVDRYAEEEAEIFFLVDANGDGQGEYLPEPPRLRVRPAPPARLWLSVPTTLRPGASFEAHLALLDRIGNRLRPGDAESLGSVELALPPGISGPARVRLDAAGRASVPLRVAADASADRRVHRLRARALVAGAASLFEAESAPIVVGVQLAPVLWADLHGHSSLSDGTGTPEDYFRYARDVAHLDVAALTDHDHWGVRFLDERPEAWLRIRSAVAAAHEAGEFVALVGYEWTSWLHGHRHVLYFDDDGRDAGSAGELHSFIDERTENPNQLWDALAGRDALTFAHHSAGGPIPTNWDYAPDPHFEPVTEIVSAHGSSEAADSPRPIYEPVRGNFVRGLLGRGFRLGFIGSGDGHDGHPGLVQLGGASGNGGLAALVGAERTRDGVLAALRARRSYATSGPRIFLDVKLDGEAMGAELPLRAAGASQLQIEVAAVDALESVDIVRSGKVHADPARGRRDWQQSLEIPALFPGETLYVRAVQRDGHAAWSSPFFCCAP